MPIWMVASNIRIRETFKCIGIPKYAKHWRLSLFRYETFITFLTFRFSTRRERERDTHTIFTMLTVPSDLTTRRHPVVHNWTGLAQVQKSTLFVQPQISTNCFFSKIPQNPQPIASGHDVIYIPSPISSPGFLLWHLWLSHPPRASVNCALII